MEQVDVIVVGAGAAGLFCGAEAARRGRRVVVLDHVSKPAEKIRISGGGRCNFTNLHVAADRFWSRNPHFAKSALARYTQWDFISLVDQHGIPWHEKTLGQLFCDTSARDIIQMLLRELDDAGGALRLETPARAVDRVEGGWQIVTPRGVIAAQALVVATGGKSIPKMGATGFGYDIARKFGVPVVETRPALVPLTFGERDLARTRELAGVSVSAAVHHPDARFAEGLLFTHRGLSGPSILQISSVWREGNTLVVDLAAGKDAGALLRDIRAREGRVEPKTALARAVPARLAEQVMTELGVEGRLADQSDSVVERIAKRVHAWQVTPTGSEGYRTAEVTLGGVDTAALDSRTMEARGVPGLYFIGEVVDVTGWLGGYNFQWAWSSGWVAGQAA